MFETQIGVGPNKEKDTQPDRSQVVINKESGRQLEILSGVPFAEIYQKTTDQVITVLKDHDVVCVAGMSGIGKSELFFGSSCVGERSKKTR